jgi:hypothetical protein
VKQAGTGGLEKHNIDFSMKSTNILEIQDEFEY